MDEELPSPQLNIFVVFPSYFQSLDLLLVADGTVPVIWIALLNQGSVEAVICAVRAPPITLDCNYLVRVWRGNEVNPGYQTLWMFRRCYRVSAELKRQGSC